ncbi:MAG: glycosyltransferase [Sarcina sp.]
MVVFFTCIFILITVFSFLHIYQVYRYNMFTKKKEEKVISEVSIYRDIAMIVPCYNEEVVVSAAVNNFSKLTYPNLKVMFVNDGSKDKTLELLSRLLDLENMAFDDSKFLIKCNTVRGIYQSKKYSNMIVIDKENGGKADSLNAAINFVNSDFIVTLDADSILKDDALDQINSVIQDPKVIATGGNIITSQGVQNFSGDKIYYKVPRKIVEGIQFIDYLKGFFITKNSYANLRALAVISGAFGVFKKDVMFAVGGFTKSIGEDIDITIKFHKYAKEHNKKIVFNDKAMCFTEVPNNWNDFFKQRVRWQKGFIDAFKHHYKFLFKNILTDRLSFFMVFENLILAYISIVCMLIGFYYWGYDEYNNIPIGWLMWIVIFIGIVIYLLYDITIFIMASKSSITISKKSILKIIFLLIYEVIIFRQIMVVVYIWGSIEYFFKPHSWNKVQRNGANNLIDEIHTEEITMTDDVVTVDSASNFEILNTEIEDIKLLDTAKSKIKDENFMEIRKEAHIV